MKFKSYSRPKMVHMAKDFSKALIEWKNSGFNVVTPEEYDSRLEACKKCEFFNPEAFLNTGRCMKCGCSIRAKLRIISSKCPIGKW